MSVCTLQHSTPQEMASPQGHISLQSIRIVVTQHAADLQLWHLQKGSHLQEKLHREGLHFPIREKDRQHVPTSASVSVSVCVRLQIFVLESIVH